MAWIAIENTNLEYDNDAYNNLPEIRQQFWDKQNDIIILNGIRTCKNGNEIYMRTRKIDTDEPVYFENEVNKTYLNG